MPLIPKGPRNRAAPLDCPIQDRTLPCRFLLGKEVPVLQGNRGIIAVFFVLFLALRMQYSKTSYKQGQCWNVGMAAKFDSFKKLSKFDCKMSVIT